MENKEKKKSLWEQMGRKTESSEEKEKMKKAEEDKKKEKEVANIRGTKIYKDGSRGY